MPFSRPTLDQLRAQAAADISSSLPGSDALLRFSNLGILAQVVAAMAAGHYGYLDWIAKQAVPFTATNEYLEAWAALKNITRKAATPASGTVTFTGGNGTPIPAATPVVRSDGTAFVTTALGTIASGSATVPVQASLAGAAGNAASGVVMNLGTVIPGVTSAGVAATALTGGSDVESDAALRGRMLLAYQQPPLGGDLADYVTWALAVAGVTRAWTVPLDNGAGTVGVYFMMDVTEAAFGGFPQGANGVATLETRDTPATGDQLAVANSIYPLRPVTALVYAKAPGNNVVTFTLNGIASAPPAVKTAITAAIAAIFLTYGAPGGVVDLSYIESAIAAISGTAGFVVTTVACTHGTVSPGTNGNITSSAGYIPTCGPPTYT